MKIPDDIPDNEVIWIEFNGSVHGAAAEFWRKLLAKKDDPDKPLFDPPDENKPLTLFGMPVNLAR